MLIFSCFYQNSNGVVSIICAHTFCLLSQVTFDAINFSMDETSWRDLQYNKETHFVKNLAVAIWGSDVLINRSVTGVTSNNQRGTNVVPRPKLTPRKVEFIKGEKKTISRVLIRSARMLIKTR